MQHLRRHVNRLVPSDASEGLVLRATAGFFDVQTAEGIVRAKLRGRLKKVRKKTDLCVIGDRVRLHRTDDADAEFAAFVEEVMPRERIFSRRHPGPGGRYREDVLVANLDRLFCVFAFGDPPFHPRMLDRFLVICEHVGIAPTIVANKVDQEEPEQRARLEQYAELGYELLFTSAKSEAGLQGILDALDGHISALVGPSGVGKSSLLNAIEPGLGLKVAGTSAAHSKGRHTTRVATLYELAGGYLADTPGIRELGAWELPEEDLDRCFPELRPYLGQCGFRNCRHRSEPHCAVKDALAAGAIQPERYESYLRLLDDDER